MRRLFEHIYKYKNALESSQLKLEKINQKLFPHLSRKSFTNQISKLYKETESFLICDELNKSEIESDVLLIRSLSKRGLSELANVHIKQSELKFSQKNKLDLWNVMHLMRIKHIQFFSENPIIYTDQGFEIFNQLVNYKEIFYQTISQFYTNHELYLRNETSILEDQSTIGYYAETQKTTTLFKQVHEFLRQPTLEKSKDLFEIVNTNSLSFEIGYALLHYIKAYTTEKLGNGDLSLIKSHLNEQRKIFELKRLDGDSSISAIKFHNYLNIAFSFGEMEDGISFMNEMLKFLPKSERDESKNFATAQLKFGQNKYEEAIEILSKLSFKKAVHKMSSRQLLLMSYYHVYTDTNDFLLDQIKNYLDSLRYNQSKLSNRNYTGHKHFADILKTIILESDIDKLKKKINSHKIIHKRYWLNSLIEDKQSATN